MSKERDYFHNDVVILSREKLLHHSCFPSNSHFVVRTTLCLMECVRTSVRRWRTC